MDNESSGVGARQYQGLVTAYGTSLEYGVINLKPPVGEAKLRVSKYMK